MRKKLLEVAVVLLCASCSFGQPHKHNVVPRAGVVPDAQTAKTIAVAIWIPIYGKKQIQNQAPFNAKLKGDVWFVNGSLPRGHIGGVAEIEIARNDGRVLRISHGR